MYDHPEMTNGREEALAKRLLHPVPYLASSSSAAPLAMQLNRVGEPAFTVRGLSDRDAQTAFQGP
jgi:hypothetical protein